MKRPKTLSTVYAMQKHSVFISSVQKELAAERRALKTHIHGDPLLRRFFDVFLFEDIPASDRRADDVYLDEVERCNIYIGLFGNEYGQENAEGISATEREFVRATAKGKSRMIFVKGTNDKGRHPKMLALARKAGDQLIRRRFAGVQGLTKSVSASLVEWLDRQGVIQNRPFDERAAREATLKDIDGAALQSSQKWLKRLIGEWAREWLINGSNGSFGCDRPYARLPRRSRGIARSHRREIRLHQELAE